MSQIPPSYLPTPSSLQITGPWIPFYGLELVVPWFQPLGVPILLWDKILFGLAIPIGIYFLYQGWKQTKESPFFMGIGITTLSIIPTIHVLHNAGGQWYLLLPSFGIALSWGAIYQNRKFLWCFIAIGTIITFVETLAWRKASIQIDTMIEVYAQSIQDNGWDSVTPPTKQNPTDWPHRGPSFCCGLPYQLFVEPNK